MSWKKVEKDIEGGPRGTFKWVAITVIAFVALFGVISAVTRPASMAVDRIVQKNSFQYKEGMESRAATLQAQIADPGITPEQKKYFEAQLRAITINQ